MAVPWILEYKLYVDSTYPCVAKMKKKKKTMNVYWI